MASTLRIGTWNTYLAFTMPHRHKRYPEILHSVRYLSHQSLDILCLQELNSPRVGFLGFCLYRLVLSLYLLCTAHSAWAFACPVLSSVMQYVEYYAAIEGLLMPLFVIDNSQLLLDYAKHNTAFKYACHSPMPTYYLNAGHVILSRHPIVPSSMRAWTFRGDSANAPGMLSCEIDVTETPARASSAASSSSASTSTSTRRWRIYAVHLVPTLLDTQFHFKLLNILNRWRDRDPLQLRVQQIDTIVHEVQRDCERDPELLIAVCGDFNVTHNTLEQQRVDQRLQQAGLHKACLTPEKPTACEHTFSHEGQIDYIYLHKRVLDLASQVTQHIRHEEMDDVKARLGLYSWPQSDGSLVPVAATKSHSGNNLNSYKNGHSHGSSKEDFNAERLLSTRVESMLSSDHYPVLLQFSLPLGKLPRGDNRLPFLFYHSGPSLAQSPSLYSCYSVSLSQSFC